MEERLNRIVTIGEAILLALENIEKAVGNQNEIPLNRTQAAAYLGVSVSTINNYEKKGLRKSVKSGIAGYLPSDLEKFRK